MTIAILALLATFYQLYLQRVHNEKSLKPLGMIEFMDRKDRISIHLHNNGVGPLILEKFEFTVGQTKFANVELALSLDPKSFMHYTMEDGISKVIATNCSLEILETEFDLSDGQLQRDLVRKELSALSIKAFCRDIYDNRIIVERNCGWFGRSLARATNVTPS